MDKYKAFTVIGIWVGVGISSIGMGIAGPAAFQYFHILAICAAIASWLTVCKHTD